MCAYLEFSEAVVKEATIEKVESSCEEQIRYEKSTNVLYATSWLLTMDRGYTITSIIVNNFRSNVNEKNCENSNYRSKNEQ